MYAKVPLYFWALLYAEKDGTTREASRAKKKENTRKTQEKRGKTQANTEKHKKRRKNREETENTGKTPGKHRENTGKHRKHEKNRKTFF